MAAIFDILVFVVICVISISASNKKKGKKQAKPAKRSDAGEREYTPEPQQRKYYDSTCMEADTQHDHDRRTEQLKDFLKDGIIDKEEYKILLDRYEHNI